MNEEETELFPEDEDADLAPPPGATEHDELGCALALGQARRAAEELLHSGERPGPVNAGGWHCFRAAAATAAR